MKNISKILTLSTRMAMIYFITMFAIMPCMAISKITLNKKEKIKEIIEVSKETPKEKESRNVSSLFIGPNIGYNLTEATGSRRYKINNYSIGLHIDYNHPLSELYFIGCGYSFSHLPLDKVNVLFHKKNSQYFTVKAGKLLNDNVSVNVNLSMVISEFNMRSAIFTYEYNNMESKIDFHRVGVAPGIGLILHLDKNFSAGLNYSYEIYPTNNARSRPRILTHNFITKFSYHI